MAIQRNANDLCTRLDSLVNRMDRFERRVTRGPQDQGDDEVNRPLQN